MQDYVNVLEFLHAITHTNVTHLIAELYSVPKKVITKYESFLLQRVIGTVCNCWSIYTAGM